MRRVEINMREFVPYDGTTGSNAHYKDKYIDGYFHQWGVADAEDSESGFNVTVAIVELDCGDIVMVNPMDVRFVDSIE